MKSPKSKSKMLITKIIDLGKTMNSLNEVPTTNVRKILDQQNLLTFMLTNNRPWCNTYIAFYDRESDRYQTITRWCNIATDLISLIPNQISCTHNGIVYDHASASFVEFNDEFDDSTINIDLSSIYPAEFRMYITLDRRDFNFFPESLLPNDHLVQLEQQQIISPRIVINSQFLMAN
ncbi:MAG: hypothetical protein ACMG6E_00515 [Candidatus Roizmanbacteria bacterium]